MRLTVQQQTAIRTTVSETFGADAQVCLFGSRTDDTKRGGDIDLLITTRLSDIQTIMRAEISLLTKLQNRLGEQKIDVLLDYPSRKERPPIFSVARKTGIVL